MLDDCRATHPFDDHPSLTDRLQALGVPIDPEHLQALLAAPGDGRWYYNFDKAEEIECRQWDEFERKFCSQHEQGLAFQLLPESEKEREIVAKWFPEVTFSGKRSSLALACDWIHFSEWPGRVYFREVTNLIFMDGWIYVDLTRDENVRVSFKLNALGKEKAAAYKALGEYYGRYRAALANLEKQDSDDTETGTDYSDQALSG